MSNPEFRSEICPKCGETLSVPAHLKEFSCLYCGERLKAKDRKDADAKEFYDAHILQAITNHIGIDKKVTGSEYAPAFAHYVESNAETFRQLELAISSGAYTPEEAVRYFLDRLEAYWVSDNDRNKKLVLQQDKFVIAVFLVPMVRSLKLPISEDYCQALQKLWCERNPKSPFYLGNYEDMLAGFRKKTLGGMCFITTAVCRHSGKADDCAELTAFRAFRDNYLKSCPDGPALISRYYDIAPGILLQIDLRHDRDEIYGQIRKQYLTPCYDDICQGRLHQCKKRYTEMVEDLQRRYLQ